MAAWVHAVEIDVYHALPVGWVAVLEWRVHPQASIIKQQVEPAEPLPHLIENRRNLLRICHIGRECQRSWPEFSSQRLDAVASPCHQHHMHTFRDEQARSGLANSTRSSSNKSDFSRQILHFHILVPINQLVELSSSPRLIS